MTETQSETRRQVLLSRAWRRAFEDESGKALNEDGRMIIRSLLRKSDFFGRQYDPTNPTETLIRAVKRQFVIDILAHLNLKDESLPTLIEIETADD